MSLSLKSNRKLDKQQKPKKKKKRFNFDYGISFYMDKEQEEQFVKDVYFKDFNILGGLSLTQTHLTIPNLRRYLKLEPHIPILIQLTRFAEPHKHLTFYYRKNIDIKEFMVMDFGLKVVSFYNSFDWKPPQNLVDMLEKEYNEKLDRPPHKYNYNYIKNVEY